MSCGKKAGSSALLLAFLLLLALPSAYAVSVSACLNITSSGTYNLTSNVSIAGSTCFNITAANVILNCNGYGITGNGTNNTFGIYSNSPGTSISNCNISGFMHGIFFNLSNSSTITNTKSTSSIPGGYGAYFLNSHNGTMSGSSIASIYSAKPVQINSPFDINFGSDGFLYFADRNNNRIRKINVTTNQTYLVAGGWIAGRLEGAYDNAMFNLPYSAALGPDGFLYVSDYNNHRIRKINLTTNQTYLVAGRGYAGYAEGAGGNAVLYNPTELSFAPDGFLYFADYSNNRIRKINITTNQTYLVAGNGTGAYAEGVGGSAALKTPAGSYASSDGFLYFADLGNNRIRKIDLATNQTYLVAGSGTATYAEGTGSGASFNSPAGVAMSTDGWLYVADQNNHRIRKINVTTNQTFLVSGSGGATYAEGTGSGASFYSPAGVSFGTDGWLYVADQNNHRIRKINVTTNQTFLVAGNGTAAYSEGYVRSIPAQGLYLYSSTGNNISDTNVSSYSSDAIYLAQNSNNNTFTNTSAYSEAGNGYFIASGFNTTIDCRGAQILGANITNTYGINTLANYTNIYGCNISNFMHGIYMQSANHSRAINTTSSTTHYLGNAIYLWGTNITVERGNYTSYFQSAVNVSGATYSTFANLSASSLLPAYAARMYNPSGVAVGPDGFLYFSDRYNHRIRKLNTTTFQTYFVAGNDYGYYQEGVGDSAFFSQPIGLMFGPDGYLYVGDYGNNRIRRINVTTNQTFAFAGSGAATYMEGNGTQSDFNGPLYTAFGTDGFLYVSDYGNHRIRKINTTTGETFLVAGSGTGGYLEGAGSGANLRNPWGLAFGADGFLYFADNGNHRIRKINVTTNQTYLVAGSGTATYAEGTGATASFYAPTGIVFGPDGFLYISDQANRRIRTINTTTNITALFAGSGGASLVDGVYTGANVYDVYDIAFDGSKYFYLADFNNNRIRRMDSATSEIFTISGDPTFGYLEGAWTPYAMPNSFSLSGAGNNITNVSSSTVNGYSFYTSGASNDANFTANTPVSNYSSTYYISNGQRVIIDCAGIPMAGTNRSRATAIWANQVNTTVKNCNISNYFYPIYYTGINNGTIYNNTVWSPTFGGVGIYVTGSNYLNISNNFANATYGNALYSNCGYCNIYNNYLNSSYQPIPAMLYNPYAVAFGPDGYLYFADSNNHRIRKMNITTTQTYPVAGSSYGYVEGKGEGAKFNFPISLAFGYDGYLYVSDYSNHRIRRINITTNETSLVIGNGTAAYAEGNITTARVYNPRGLAVGADGFLYFADMNNHRIRKINLTTNQTYLVAGSGSSTYTDGIGAGASFYQPTDVHFGDDGYLYFTAYGNHRVSRLNVTSNQTALIAGSGSATYVEGVGSAAAFYNPVGLVYYNNTLYISDLSNNRIRKIDLSTNRTYPIAGNLTGMYGEGVGYGARFYNPVGLDMGPDGFLYVADQGNHRIRKINLTSNETFNVSGGLVHHGSNANGYREGINSIITTNPALYSSGSTGTNITNNTIYSTTSYGAYLAGNYANITGNYLYTQTSGGYYIYTGSHVIMDCAGIPLVGPMSPGTWGIYTNQYNTTIQNCNITNFMHGIMFDGTDNGTIRNNTVWTETSWGSGILVQSTALNNTIYNNTLFSYTYPALYLYSSANNNTVFNINGSTVLSGGLYLYSSSFNNVTNSTFNSTTYYGNVLTTDCNNNNFTLSNFRGVNGLYLVTRSKNNLFTNNSFNATLLGVNADPSSGNNTFYWNSIGGIYWMNNSNNTSVFNTSVGGVAQGNYYSNISFFGVYDSNGDGWADFGPSYPLNSTTVPNRWTGNGTDFGPATTSNGSTIRISSCGELGGATFALDNDVYINGTNCFNVSGINTVLDCEGHSIIGNNTINTSGVHANVSNASIRNCNISGFQYGIYFNATTGGFVQNTTANSSMFNGSGIFIYYSPNVSINSSNAISSYPTLQAQFYNPSRVAFGSDGYLYVADQSNFMIRRINVTTNTTMPFAGKFYGSREGILTNASFASIYGIYHSNGYLYIGDNQNHRVRKLNLATGETSLLGGNGTAGYTEGVGNNSTFYTALAAILAPDGFVYVADYNNHRIRRINPTTLQTSLVAGSGSATYVEGAGSGASIRYPTDLAYGADGFLYFADQGNNRIRKINLTTNQTYLVAGSGSATYAEGAGSGASFYNPTGLAFGPDGLLYIADQTNGKIRSLNITTNQTYLVAGGAANAYVEGVGSNARFYNPSGLAFDPAGWLYVADQTNHRIRKINTTTNQTYLIAGNGIGGYVEGSGLENMSGWSGINITNSNYVNVSNTNTSSTTNRSIYLTASSNVTLANISAFSNYTNAIELASNSHNFSIRGVGLISSVPLSGIYLGSGQNSSIDCAGGKITGYNFTQSYGIYSVHYNTSVSNCDVSNFVNALYFNNVVNGSISGTNASTTHISGSGGTLYNWAQFNNVTNSRFFSQYNSGLYVTSNSHNTTIINSSANSISSYGLYVYNTNYYTKIFGSNFSSNSSMGAYINYLCNNTTIDSSNFYTNASTWDYGALRVENSNNFTLTNSFANSSNYSSGINFYNLVNNSKVINVTTYSSNSAGIALHTTCNYNLLQNVSAYSINDTGLYIYSSNYNNITNSSFNGSKIGANLQSLSYSIFNGSYFTANSTYAGILLQTVSYSNFTNNTVNTTNVEALEAYTTNANTYNNFISNRLISSNTSVYLNSQSTPNYFYYNTLDAPIWVNNNNNANYFNTTVAGRAQGNSYSNISSYDVVDTNGDFYADSGSQYPLNSSNAPGKWVGSGADYGPAATRVSSCANITSSNLALTLNNSFSTNSAVCFNITGNSNTIDCGGNQISGVNASGSIGFAVSGTGNTLRNCRIGGFERGIMLSGAVSATVTTSSSESSPSSSGAGILIQNSNLSTISSSNFTSSNGDAVLANTSSQLTLLNVTANSTAGNAIMLLSTANSTIRQSNLSSSGSDAAIFQSSTNIEVSNSSISAPSGTALALDSGSSSNGVFYNKISALYWFNNSNSGNQFNTSVGGVAQGNFYSTILSYAVTDRDNDGWGDSGAAYPLGTSTSNGAWMGLGYDYGPGDAKNDPKTNISFCGVMKTAGTTYTLTKNFSSNSTCISVVADNVTINCSGYSIAGSNQTATYGIFSSAFNTTVIGCNVSSFQHALFLSGANLSNVSGNSLSTTHQSGSVIFLNQSTNGSFTNNSLLSNGGGYAFTADSLSGNNVFYYNTITGSRWINSQSQSNQFNTTVGGVARGNTYPEISSYAIYDSNGDLWGDSGSDYPLNSTSAFWAWSFFGADYGPATASRNISACAQLSNANSRYVLLSNVSGSSGACFNITAANVSLDCRGNSIIGTSQAGSIGVYTNQQNNSVSNCTIGGFAYALYIAGQNGTFTQNTLNASTSALLATASSSGNLIYKNTFNSQKWVDNANAANLFNTTSGGVAMGNYYLNASAYSLTDSNGDGWAEGGASYPFSQSTLGASVWSGLGADYAPYYPKMLSSCARLNYSGTYLLSSDIIASDSCLEVGASDVLIDCGGRWINGSGAGIGIVSNYNRTKISNCRISNFLTGVQYSGSQGGLISNNTISASGSLARGIILLPGSHSNLIANNNISSTVDFAALLSSSNNCTLTDNSISSLSASALRTFWSNFTTISSNNITSVSANALSLENSAYGTIYANRLVSSSASGIALYTSSSFDISSNILNSTSSVSATIALSSSGNNFSSNYFASPVWLNHSSAGQNSFSKSVSGTQMGNTYYGIDSYRLNDTDGNGYADSGTQYPLNSSNANGQWIGGGSDGAPRWTWGVVWAGVEANPNYENGMREYWKLNEPNVTIWQDSSAYSNSLNAFGGVYYTSQGRISGAASFDGTGVLLSSSQVHSPVSISLWCNGGSGWVHVVNSNGTVYSNGTLGVPPCYPFELADGKARIGRLFTGRVDDVRIYSRALTANDAANIYSQKAYLYNDLVFSPDRFAENSSSIDSSPANNILYYTFNSNISSLSSGAISDLSPSGNSGTLGGGNAANAPTWSSNGKYGGAYYFDGGDRIEVPNVINGKTKLSFTGWFKYQNGGNWRWIFGTGSGGTYIGAAVASGGNSLRYHNPCNTGLNGNTTLTPDTWYHFAYVYDSVAGYQRGYINGNLEYSYSCSAQLSTSATNAIGSGFWANNEGFLGYIDEPRFYNTSLSVSEIMDSMQESGSTRINSSALTAGYNYSSRLYPKTNYSSGYSLQSANITVLESVGSRSCALLNTDGSTTFMASNISAGSNSTCFNVTANNVLIDCKGNSIIGNGLAGSAAITSNSSSTTIVNCVFSNWSTDINLLQTSSGALAYNNTFTGTLWVNNSGSGGQFNTSVNGTAQGNYYSGISGYAITDSDGDGWGDSGSQYPMNSTNSNGKWLGAGQDFGPKTNVSAALTLLSKCGNLTTPSVQYVLASDLSFSGGACLYAQADNITINCAGRSITGSGNQSEVAIASGSYGTTVSNCKIKSVAIGAILASNSSSISGSEINASYAGLILGDMKLAGIIGYWPFDQNSSTQSPDESGYGRNANVSGPLWVANGLVGGAYNFSADPSKYISIPGGIFDGLGSITYSVLTVWNPNGATYGGSAIHSWVPAGFTAERYQDSSNCVLNTDSGGVSTGATHPAMAAGLPYMQTCTYDGSALKSYVNSFAVGSIPTSGNVRPHGLIKIGNRSDTWTGMTGWNGTIDEIRFYSRGLSPIEVELLYLTRAQRGYSGIFAYDNTIASPNGTGIMLFSSVNSSIYSNSISAGSTALFARGQSNLSSFFLNNISARTWVDSNASGLLFNTTVNGSGVGNIYYFANGTPSWQVFAISDSDGNGFADLGSSRPFNATTVGSLWANLGGDSSPFTTNLPSTCQNITTPGQNVSLQNDVSSKDSSCFVISAENVSINCNGNSIIGNNASGTYGIYSNRGSTIVANCIISNFSMGIYYNGSSNGRISNVTMMGGSATAASGGSTATFGQYRSHTFTSNGTFTVTSGISSVEVLVVAGGGGGGGLFGGGGGAGGLIYNSSFAVSPGNYNVIVGDGGAGGIGDVHGSSGTNSSFANLVAIGGGGGGTNYNVQVYKDGYSGGSGGGGSGTGAAGYGGAGTVGQGNSGGANMPSSPAYGSGGGGGAGASGSTGTSSAGGNGGVGLAYSIQNGNPVYYAGGGGGSTYSGNGAAGIGGLGGGGNGSISGAAQNGTAYAGGGGGGGSNGGGNGGSGIVIVKYLYKEVTAQVNKGIKLESSSNNSLEGIAIIASNNALDISGGSGNNVTMSNLSGTDSSVGALSISNGSKNNVVSNSSIAGQGGARALALSGGSNTGNTFFGNLIQDADVLLYVDSNSGSNTFYLNTFSNGTVWVVSGASNTFDTTIEGKGVGNTYYFQNGSGAWTVFNISDTDFNLYADSGSDLPFNATTVGGNWSGLGGDYHPAARNQLQNCTVISDPGTTYFLGSNISAPTPVCFDIQAQNVTLDCAGNSISNSAGGGSASSSQIEAIVGTSSWAGYYSFDAGTTSTATGALKDDSSVHNDATLGGGNAAYVPSVATGSSCKINSCYVFDNSNDLINVPYSSNLELNDGGTVTAWWYKTDTGSGRIVMKNDDWYLDYDSGLIMFRFYSGGGSLPTASYPMANVPLNSWVHVAGSIVRDGSNYYPKLYINGNPVSTDYSVSSLSSNGNPVIIGNSGDSGVPLGGTLDEVMIFNRTLNDSEVLAISQIVGVSSTQSIGVNVNASGAKVRNCGIQNFSVGVNLTNAADSLVFNNTIAPASGGYAIYAGNSQSANISKNRIFAGGANGIGIIGGGDKSMIDCAGSTISGGATGGTIGVYFNGSDATVKNCSIQNFSMGVNLNGSANSYVYNNSFGPTSGGYAIYASGSTNSNLFKNSIYAANANGVWITGAGSNMNALDCNGANISGDNSAGTIGVFSDQANTSVLNCQMSLFDNAVKFQNASFGSIRNNTILVGKTTSYSIFLNATTNTTVSGNNATSLNNTAIYLLGSSNNTVSENTAMAGNYVYLVYYQAGISLDNSSFNNVLNNNATVNSTYDGSGIILNNGANNNTVSGNNGNSGMGRGIFVFNSNCSQIVNNVCRASGDADWKTACRVQNGHWNNISSNEMYAGSSSLALGFDSGSANNTVSGNKIVQNGSQTAASLSWVSDITMYGNNISAASNIGLNAYQVPRLRFYGNRIETNISGYGLYYWYGSDSALENNTVSALTNYAFYIRQITNSNISGNSLTTNSSNFALYLSGATGNTFFGNVLRGSKWVYNDNTNNFNTTINGKGVGNAYYFANGTPSWSVFSLSDTDANNYADSGASRPFNATTVGGNWSGIGGDWFPYIDISGNCGVYSTANRAITLGASISTSGSTCINITAENVTINCAGYSITGNNSTGSNGIYSSAAGTQIRNCRISGFQYPVYLDGTSNGVVAGNALSTTHAQGSAIYSSAASGSNSIYLNAFSGATWVSNYNPTNQFNSTVDGSGVGNIYPNASSYRLSDSDGNRFADGGADLPFGASTLGSLWQGVGGDYNPGYLIATPANCSNISTGMSISQSNQCYSLRANVSSSGTIFNISGSNVSIYCNNYYLTGTNAPGSIGIDVRASNVTIDGCQITGYHTGVLVENAKSVQIRGMAINLSSSICLNVVNTSNSRFTHYNFTSCTEAIRIDSNSANNTFAFNNFANYGLWVNDSGSGNKFNTTVGGYGRGNYYWNWTAYNLTDSNSDGYADGGTSYPFSSTTLGPQWIGTGIDYAPGLYGPLPTGQVGAVVTGVGKPVTLPRDISKLALVQGGAITQLNLQINSTTLHWQGFYGNIEGSLKLASGANVVKFWNVSNKSGQIYVSPASNIFFPQLNITPITLSDLDKAFPYLSGADDSASLTGVPNSNSQFNISMFPMAANSRPVIFSRDSTGAASWGQVVLGQNDPTYKDGVIFAGIIRNSQVAFNGENADFQLVVPASATGNATPETYYFYGELR